MNTPVDLSLMSIDQYFDYLDSLGSKAPHNSEEESKLPAYSICDKCHEICKVVFAKIHKNSSTTTFCSDRCFKIYEKEILEKNKRRSIPKSVSEPIAINNYQKRYQ